MAQQLEPWLYNPELDFFDNLKFGPFGNFDKQPPYKNEGEPKYDFFGTKVYSPFGIAAGPLPQAKFVKSALDRGYDIVTFKTVRSHTYPSHDMPNVFPLEYKKYDPSPTKPKQSYVTKDSYDVPLTLTNSFGIPSFEPEVWQKEIKKSFALIKKGQALLVAFQGTLQHEGHDAFVEDFIFGIGKLRETGARLIEINLSCPNEGHSNFLCFDIKTSREILKKVSQTYPDLKLTVKLSYFYDDQHLGEFVEAVSPYVVGITAFNTLPANIIGKDGKQAFPGPSTRMSAGVSGEPVKHLSIDMTKRLFKHRKRLGADFQITGIGGVQTVEDFHNLRQAGADIVMGLTGVMWNPNLAAEIKCSLQDSKS